MFGDTIIDLSIYKFFYFILDFLPLFSGIPAKVFRFFYIFADFLISFFLEGFVFLSKFLWGLLILFLFWFYHNILVLFLLILLLARLVFEFLNLLLDLTNIYILDIGAKITDINLVLQSSFCSISCILWQFMAITVVK